MSIAQSEVHCMVGRRVVDQNADDATEGRREERREPYRRAHNEAAEPAEIAYGYPEQIASTKGSGSS